jgi:hypothetical protein
MARVDNEMIMAGTEGGGFYLISIPSMTIVSEKKFNSPIYSID